MFEECLRMTRRVDVALGVAVVVTPDMATARMPIHDPASCVRDIPYKPIVYYYSRFMAYRIHNGSPTYVSLRISYNKFRSDRCGLSMLILNIRVNGHVT